MGARLQLGAPRHLSVVAVLPRDRRRLPRGGRAREGGALLQAARTPDVLLGRVEDRPRRTGHRRRGTHALLRVRYADLRVDGDSHPRLVQTFADVRRLRRHRVQNYFRRLRSLGHRAAKAHARSRVHHRKARRPPRRPGRLDMERESPRRRRLETSPVEQGPRPDLPSRPLLRRRGLPHRPGRRRRLLRLLPARHRRRQLARAK
mmetsp:Transcript_22523/g.72471  ORF Transcript_22523/g.72471 Transcript_22523/m.72471 type:complete len:204 (+) Transcript_22523:376-987(+)